VAPPAALIREQRDLSGPVVSSAEIESSQQISDENNSHRQRRAIVVTTSSTLTVTSYSLVPYTITKSVVLGIGGCNKCVSCLPSGINIC